jgi:predicted RNA methylase
MVRRDTVAEIVAYRDAAVAAYDEYFRALRGAKAHLARAEEMASLASGGKRSSYTEGQHREVDAFQQAVSFPCMDSHERVARRLVDIRVWGHLVDHTKLDALMDKKGKDELRQQFAYVPERVGADGALINGEEIARGLPPVTEDAVVAMVEGWQDQAGWIFMRGIAEAFTNLDRRFRSHDGFKLGSRVILSGAFGGYSWSYHRNHRDTMIDIERVFRILDGKPPLEASNGGIIGTISSERMSRGIHQSEHEGEYFLVRVFKNGNAHLWFRRGDLVGKVNRLLAEYYGAGLGWGSAPRGDADPFECSALRPAARNFGLFPTPEKVAERVVEKARLYDSSLSVLEPSAGTGSLVRAVLATGRGHRVTAVEIQGHLANDLRAGGGCSRVFCSDFLRFEIREQFDRVVMNPPFDRGRDVDHVWNALKYLRPGGVLVAVMSASAEFSGTRKAVALRDLAVGELGGRFHDLPADSFAEAGTHVNTVMLVVGGSRW